VVEIVKKLESRQRGWEEEEDPERKGAIVFNATSEFCRTLGEIPTYGLAGNREEQEELMVGPSPQSRWPALLTARGCWSS
jgi:U4/U6.U5 tri-snRNP-associated protein 1